MGRLEEFIEDIRKYNPAADIELFCRAYKFAENHHAGQYRKSGETYFTHCEETVRILIDLRMDIETICAGILHDVIEDTECEPEEMLAQFGPNITKLVMGVTKISTLPFRGGQTLPDKKGGESARRQAMQQAENYRNMLLAMTGDIRVILIKLADRLHNMRTLNFLPREKQITIARETLDIFAPLAHRLGMGRIKSELEDLAFKYLEPTQYRKIKQLVQERREQREEYTRNMSALIKAVLAEEGVEAEVFGRPKHFYSIYQKMQHKDTRFEDIYDLIAFRVLVDTVAQCYAALGIINVTWTPIPGRLRDFIGLPKSNMYQSLHTTVQINARRVEIQIRTHEMHRTAEYGIAAHWRYKEGQPGLTQRLLFNIDMKYLKVLAEGGPLPDPLREELARRGIELSDNTTLSVESAGRSWLISDVVRKKTYHVRKEKGQLNVYMSSNQQFEWLQQMVADIQELKDPHQLLAAMKADLFPDEVYVFTPKGDVKALRLGATPLDFAYAIHTDLGHHCVGAKVNGEIKPLTYTLQTGDRVEILADPNARPGKDWLRIAKTPRALSKIRRWINDQEREQHQRMGIQLLESEMLKQRVNPRQYMKSEELLLACQELGFAELDDLFVSIGRGVTSAQHVLHLMFPQAHTQEAAPEEEEVEAKEQEHAISVAGIDRAVLRIAKCCQPIPGEEVVGFITRGRGLSVHHAKCPRLEIEPERQVHVDWPPTEATYPTEIVVIGEDRKGLLGDIATAIGKAGVNIVTNDGGPIDPSTASHRFTLEVTGKEQLEEVMTKIARVRGVHRVERRLPKGANR